MSSSTTEPEFGFPKHKRIVDERLLADVRGLPCMGCLSPPPSHAHHVSTKGSGGDDAYNNVMSLCGPCHAEWHQDPGKFIRKSPVVRSWLEYAERWDVLERYGVVARET
jgi:5-methylcytosine-specific restriction endonuclease McrA